jgi:hypothetical protein
MKRSVLLLLVVISVILGLFSFSWGQCPEDPNDEGECDTLNVDCWECTQPDTGSFYFIRFPFWVTHDEPNPLIDSVAAFIIPLCYTHTNPSSYCSVSSYWNRILWSPSNLPRSIFRNLVVSPTDTIHNWMMDLFDLGGGEEWSTIILDLDGTSHFWLSMIASGTEDIRFGAGNHVLLATMTFKMQDTMHVCIDSCFWPPSSRLIFSRSDGATYTPRLNLPNCYWIGPPQIRVTSPNGGEVWIVGDTHDITWVSDNFTGSDVNIEYSTDTGANWLPVINSTPNTGSYPWIIPSTLSPNCLVKVSDAVSGDPFDVSDGTFSIIQNPFFTINAYPDTQWVKQGETTGYEVVLTSFYGFNSPCTLTVSGIPPQASFAFDPPVVIPTDSSTLSIMIDSLTPLGTYPLTITGTEETKTVSDSVQVLLYVLSSLNRKPNISVPASINTYGGLQVTFPVIATDADSIDTLTLTKNGVGDMPCYPRVSPVVCYFQWTTTPADTINSPFSVEFHVDDGRDSTDTKTVSIIVNPYHVLPSKTLGDVTGDSVVEAADVVFLLNYLFVGGPPPNPPAAGDINSDCFTGISDIVWLINYLYRNGPPPQLHCLPGDFNYDGFVNMLDPPYFIDYMAYGGPPPVSMKSTDVNADCFINPVDLVYEIKYLLRGGDAPQPGCVEPKMGAPAVEPPGAVAVSISTAKYQPISRTNQIPINASFDKEVAGVELEITFDPEMVSLLPPTLTSRSQGLGLYYNLQRGKLVIGMLDINGVNTIQPGDGPILNLNFVSQNPKITDTKSIQIKKATFVNTKAQELLESVVK